MQRRQEAIAGSADSPQALIENDRDMRLFERLSKRGDWQMPYRVYVQGPEDVAQIAENREQRASVRIRAYNLLRQFQADNVRQDQTTHRVFIGQPHPAASQEAPVEPHPDTPDAVAWIDVGTADEIAEGIELLADLGLLESAAKSNGRQNGQK